MRVMLLSTLFVLSAATAARAQLTTSRIVYVHGIRMTTWPRENLVNAPAGWSHVPLLYDGSDFFTSRSGTGPYSFSRSTQVVEDAIVANCTSPNQCVVLCYSAGCARTLFAVEHLTRTGSLPSGLLWVDAAASAAGGTRIAELVTRWGIPVIAKVFGAWPNTAYELTRPVMRQTYQYIQGAMGNAGRTMYHVAGGAGIVLKFWIYLFTWCPWDNFICFNFYYVLRLDSNDLLNGHGDGAVGFDSAGGYAAASGSYPDLCSGAKYQGRRPQYPGEHDCTPWPTNHFGMPAVGAADTAYYLNMSQPQLAVSAMAATYQTNSDRPQADCGYDDCDLPSHQPSPADILGGGGAASDRDVSGMTCGDGACNTLSPHCGAFPQVGPGNSDAQTAGYYDYLCGFYKYYYGNDYGYCRSALDSARAAHIYTAATGTCSAGNVYNYYAGLYDYYCRYYEYLGYGWDYGGTCSAVQQFAAQGGCGGCHAPTQCTNATCSGKACGAVDECGNTCCSGSGCTPVNCATCQTANACGSACVQAPNGTSCGDSVSCQSGACRPQPGVCRALPPAGAGNTNAFNAGYYDYLCGYYRYYANGSDNGTCAQAVQSASAAGVATTATGWGCPTWYQYEAGVYDYYCRYYEYYGYGWNYGGYCDWANYYAANGGCTGCGQCNATARTIWIQPQWRAGFGPAGSLVLAGSASAQGACGDGGVDVYWRTPSMWSWQHVPYSAPADATGTWYNAIENADPNQTYSVYVTYKGGGASYCTYDGRNDIVWCP